MPAGMVFYRVSSAGRMTLNSEHGTAAFDLRGLPTAYHVIVAELVAQAFEAGLSRGLHDKEDSK